MGGSSNDTIDAGGGNDTVVYTFGDGIDVIEGGTGLDTLIVQGDAGGDMRNDTLTVAYHEGRLVGFTGGSITGVEAIRADLLGGLNTLSYAGLGTTSGVVVDLAAGTASGFCFRRRHPPCHRR